MMNILIKNGTIVNSDAEFKADVLVADEKIIKVSPNLKDKAEKVIDATGKFVMPGFIDLHTHLRTPGREDEENLSSGSRAAVKGGFTTIFCMPNTNPCLDNEGLSRWIVEQAKDIDLVDIYPIGAITVQRAGRELAEFGALKEAGCLALSDDGNSVENSLMFRRALEYAQMLGLLIISHCEDKTLTGTGVMRESFIASQYGIGSVPDISETLRVYRDIELAKYVHARLHLAHISCAKSIEIIKQTKRIFPLLSCETAPHYFLLTVDDVEKSNFSGNFRVNPPLGEQKDIKAIRQALSEGVIDCIATDHAPHSPAEKELPFEIAPAGFIGLQTVFSLTYTYLVKEKVLSRCGLVEKLSANPAKVMRLSGRGRIKEGLRADVVIVDLDKEWRIMPDNLVSKSKNTPFMGRKVGGVVEQVIRRGRIVYADSQICYNQRVR